MELISLLRIFVAIAFGLLYVVVWLVALAGTCTIYARYSRRPWRQRKTDGPHITLSDDAWGVSILRPLKGLDPELEYCLESAFQQDYPRFEVLLSVAEEEDPAVSVAREVIARYPDISARLIIGNRHSIILQR